MGKVNTTENENGEEPKVEEVTSVKASELKKYYESGAYSVAEVAEHFDVEESLVLTALKLNEQGDDLDEFNQPKK